MKTKTLLLTGLFLVGLVLMIPQSAISQELLWANVEVNRILQTSAHAQTRLTEVGVSNPFENKLFNISNDKQDAMLAILLTADSMGKNVRIAFYDGNPATIILVGTISD